MTLFSSSASASFFGREDLDAMLALHALRPHWPTLAHGGHSNGSRAILTQSLCLYVPPPLFFYGSPAKGLLGVPRAASVPHQPPESSKSDRKFEGEDEEWSKMFPPEIPGFPPEEEEEEEEEENADEDSYDQDDDDDDDPDADARNADHRLLDTSFDSKHKPLNRDPPMKIRAVKLAAFFGLWYSQIVIFNIFNKKALTVFPYPWLLASFQLLVASLWMSGLWVSGIQSYPLINRKFFFALLAPALFHTVGHVSSCVSLSKLSVSFAHVIKSSDPVFSVVLSALHGQFYPIHVWLSVVPIAAGCALASVTEVNLDAQGLWGALISNVGFALRNIYSTQSLYEFNHVEGLALYGWLSIISLVFLFPVAVFVEGRHWVTGYRTALADVASPWSFYSWVLLSGVFYHLYNQTSYRALDEISSLAFSVGNTMKRAVVIAASVIAFRNPVRPLNALGSAVALFGTFMYSQATAMGKWKKKKKKEVVAKRDS